MAKLFSVFHLRTIAFKNRIFVSPMCQYSSADGMPNDWHLVHLGSRAVGGAALVIVEATAVSPEGRISPWDSGIWSDAQAGAFERITAFIKAQGAVAGIQLAHAGRKASTDVPWGDGGPVGEENGGWRPLAPSAIPFDAGSPMPRAMTAEEIEAVTARFEAAAKRSLEAGFEVVELHMAHGYLLHEFLSPLSNQREDRWGVSPEGRRRLPLKVVEAVRNVWPEHLPLFVRISCTDWVSGGWDLGHSIELCRHLKELGVDLIDCSSGGLVPNAVIPAGPGYQTPFAAAIRRDVGIPTGAVGCITEPVQAEQIVSTGQADAVVMARELLRDPYWPLHAARSLDTDLAWPPQYRRAKPTR
jgi:2,4-dienoyl-CoA reductase-like NADH-dependent reductase (Old Yellow Enzyme family)